MPDVSVLHVLLHGKRIGTLTSVGRDATIFAFDEGYIDDEGRDTLSLSFKSILGTLITDFGHTDQPAPVLLRSPPGRPFAQVPG